MIDWTKSMTQTFEFYKVDVHTWEDIEPLDAVKSCRITRDETNETLEHATFDCTTQLDEQYIRVYLIAIQNGVKEKLPLGTFLVQTPSVGFDGKQFSISLDAYCLNSKTTIPHWGTHSLKKLTLRILHTVFVENTLEQFRSTLQVIRSYLLTSWLIPRIIG